MAHNSYGPFFMGEKMRRKHKLKSIKNKSRIPKVRMPLAKPTIRHKARKGTGYNREAEKRELRRTLCAND